jgi:hypothetical protein
MLSSLLRYNFDYTLYPFFCQGLTFLKEQQLVFNAIFATKDFFGLRIIYGLKSPDLFSTDYAQPAQIKAVRVVVFHIKNNNPPAVFCQALPAD